MWCNFDAMIFSIKIPSYFSLLVDTLPILLDNAYFKLLVAK